MGSQKLNDFLKTNFENPFYFYCFVFLFVILLVSTGHASQLPLGHWAYDFLERMEAKGIICDIRDGSRPFTRSRVADYTIQIYHRVQKDPALLTSVEYARLQRLMGELNDELKSSHLPILKSEKEPHLYSWYHDDELAHFDILTGGFIHKRGQDAPETERSINSGYYGGILRVRAWGIDAYSDNRIQSEWGSRIYLQHYNPSEGYPIGTSRDSSQATWDRSNSYLAWQYKGIQLLWGRDKVAWGPSYWGGLMQSGLAPEMDMIKLTTDLGASRFTWIHGELRSDFEHKWMVSHRIEISFKKTLDVGFDETVIYGNRSIEFAYLNPVLPYLVAEHTLGDKDNVTMGLDFDFHPGNNIKWYGDLFIDDLFAPWEIFNDFWGNKLAFTLGMLWVDPIAFTSDLRLEYTRIEPFVYTHEDSVNVFEHYDQGIGRNLQPNSDQLNIKWTCYPSVNWELALQMQYTRHGEGDRRKAHQESDGEKKKFLKGTVEKVTDVQLQCTYEFKRDLFLSVVTGFMDNRNMFNITNNNRQWPEILLRVDYNW